MFETMPFQEIHCKTTVASDFQQKIKTMTGILAVVQSSFMELGGIITAITQI